VVSKAFGKAESSLSSHCVSSESIKRQCVAVCYSVLQCVAVWCNVLHLMMIAFIITLGEIK